MGYTGLIRFIQSDLVVHARSQAINEIKSRVDAGVELYGQEKEALNTTIFQINQVRLTPPRFHRL